ncbi:uncharacterized protein [Triticum aestivum]|uniref:uncharacterized protein n=1 Tax=Triticum aestivum TaxID=4565 RepID=UPI001D01218F|nr:uncharacterized protein LOC123138532 [Triticum aestivum]
MEMNTRADQDATIVWATVVQACSMFYDTPAMLDIGEIVRAKFDFDAVGHLCLQTLVKLLVKLFVQALWDTTHRAEVLSLTANTDLRHAASFASTDGQDPRHKSDNVSRT